MHVFTVFVFVIIVIPNAAFEWKIKGFPDGIDSELGKFKMGCGNFICLICDSKSCSTCIQGNLLATELKDCSPCPDCFSTNKQLRSRITHREKNGMTTRCLGALCECCKVGKPTLSLHKIYTECQKCDKLGCESINPLCEGGETDEENFDEDVVKNENGSNDEKLEENGNNHDDKVEENHKDEGKVKYKENDTNKTKKSKQLVDLKKTEDVTTNGGRTAKFYSILIISCVLLIM